MTRRAPMETNGAIDFALLTAACSALALCVLFPLSHSHYFAMFALFVLSLAHHLASRAGRIVAPVTLPVSITVTGLLCARLQHPTAFVLFSGSPSLFSCECAIAASRWRKHPSPFLPLVAFPFTIVCIHTFYVCASLLTRKSKVSMAVHSS